MMISSRIPLLKWSAVQKRRQTKPFLFRQTQTPSKTTRRRKLQLFKKLRIPGPPPNVFFGNGFEIFRKGYMETQKEWNAKYGKILGYYSGMKPVLLVTDTELLKYIQIKDFQKFADRPIHLFQIPRPRSNENTNLINSKGSKWKEMRSIITPSFTTSKMKLMSPIMNTAIDSLLAIFDKKYETGEIFDASDLYQKLTMDVIIRTAFGIKTDVQTNNKDPLRKVLNLILHIPFRLFFILIINSFEMIRPFLAFFWTIGGKISNEGVSPFDYIVKRCDDIIKFRQQNPEQKRNDLLQSLIEGKIRDDLKVKNQLLIAGDDDNDVKREDKEENSNDKDVSNSRSLTKQEMVSNALIFLIAGKISALMMSYDVRNELQKELTNEKLEQLTFLFLLKICLLKDIFVRKTVSRFETTSTALSFCTMMLVNYPDVQEKIRQEVNELLKEESQLDYGSVQKLQYLDAVFREILRLYPPVYSFVSREAVGDAQCGSIRIPKGMAVQVPVYLLHRDPEYWPEPEKFLPERFSPDNRNSNNPLAWQPFGAGPRNCVGIRFAQMEAKLALAGILHKYKLLPTERTDKYPLQLASTPTIIRPKYGVPIRLERCGV